MDGEKSAQSFLNCTFRVIKPDRRVLRDALLINAGWPPPLLPMAARQSAAALTDSLWILARCLVCGWLQAVTTLSLSLAHSFRASVWMTTILVLPRACVLEEFVINESERIGEEKRKNAGRSEKTDNFLMGELIINSIYFTCEKTLVCIYLFRFKWIYPISLFSLRSITYSFNNCIFPSLKISI